MIFIIHLLILPFLGVQLSFFSFFGLILTSFHPAVFVSHFFDMMILKTVDNSRIFRQEMQIMGGHHDGGACSTNGFQKFYNFAPCFRVQVTRRLIGQNNVRPV